jgi:hypothetical protein
MAERDYNDDEFADIHHALGIQSTKPEDLISRHPALQIVPSGLPAAGVAAPVQRSIPPGHTALPPTEGVPEGYSLELGLSGAGHYLHTPNDEIIDYSGHMPTLQASALRHAQTGESSWGTPPTASSSVSVGGRDVPIPAAPVRTSVEDVLASPTKEGYNALSAPERQDYMSRVFFNAPNGPYSTLSAHMENLLGERAAGRELNSSSSPNFDNWMDHYYGEMTGSRDPAAMEQKRILALNPGASIADVAGVSQPAAPSARYTPQVSTEQTSGPLGDLPATIRNKIAERIGPHMDEREFADKYFGGMYHPDNFTGDNGGEISSVGNTLKFSGRLRDPVSGENIGTIDRTINPDYAYHGFLKVNPSARGTGAVPAMLSNQIDLYKKMGLSNVQLGANIDVGSYAWAKYGFVPKTEGDWSYLKRNMNRDWQQMKPRVDPEQADHVDRILADPDPHAIWDLSDVPYKAPQGFGRDDNTTIGKALLMNKSWSGKLDLNGEDSMQRFNDYVKSKMK